MSNEIIETFFFIFSCFGLLRQMKHQFFFFFPIIRKEVAIENVEHLKETFKVKFNL
jgi:hypothetical protein